MIVGIDPGTTTGVAMIGLDGNVLAVHSSRTMNLKDLIHLIIGQGFPLVVATDVTPAPNFVVRVSHLFEAVLQEPPHALALEEKRDLVRKHLARIGEEISFRNSHEKDAFAAAIKALEAYGDKFRWIDRKLEERGLGEISDRVKAMVVSGVSLSDSLSEVLSEGRKEPPRPRKEAKAVDKGVPGGRRGRESRIEISMIKHMNEEILDLKSQVKEREVKIRSLQNELERANSSQHWDIIRSKEIDTRNKMITELKRSLSRVAEDRNRLRKEMASISGSEIGSVTGSIRAIRVLPNLTKKTVAGLKSSPGRDHRVLFVKDASGAGASIAGVLSDSGTEAVVTPTKVPPQTMKSLDSAGVVVVPAARLQLLVFEELALSEERALDRALARERRNMARRAAKAATDEFGRYLADYRKGLTSRK